MILKISSNLSDCMKSLHITLKKVNGNKNTKFPQISECPCIPSPAAVTCVFHNAAVSVRLHNATRVPLIAVIRILSSSGPNQNPSTPNTHSEAIKRSGFAASVNSDLNRWRSSTPTLFPSLSSIYMAQQHCWDTFYRQFS